MNKLVNNDVLSPIPRACVFINSSDPLYPNQVINCGNNPCFKPPFPPIINPRDLVAKQPTGGRTLARAPNAFIIYRKLCVETARSYGYYLPMTVISSMASQSWEEESLAVKAEYKRIAQEATKHYKEMYPKIERRKKREKWNLVSFQPKQQISQTQQDSSKSTNKKIAKAPLLKFKTSNPSKSSSSDQPQKATNSANNKSVSVEMSSDEKYVSSKADQSNNNEISPDKKMIYPSPDLSLDDYLNSKGIEQFGPIERITSEQTINANSRFSLEYPSPDLSSGGYFDIGSLDVTDIYDEEISKWNNMSQNEIISENTFTSIYQEEINKNAIGVTEGTDRIESSGYNASKVFNLSDNLSISFSAIMGPDSYF
ncbi:16417_t:CDS:1 [Funneliformis geosporum]|uniref:3814_t:CDS:1 n=1 Tax=Funneliformis geosporum TaxID=1117311 RepID=A0A9W4SZN6_9GLOM|nr:3814_t:CDS:1 [Funneliformis geosporum]CAI2186896.1 16417_t:CDS:1 [Funneliformis geosporum]